MHAGGLPFEKGNAVDDDVAISHYAPELRGVRHGVAELADVLVSACLLNDRKKMQNLMRRRLNVIVARAI